jgi:predicted ATPase/DNA-binding SARP family transcriptional activator
MPLLPHPISLHLPPLHWTIHLLGGLRAEQDDRVAARFPTQKTAALLAYLAYFRSSTHPREQLVDRFWPDLDLDAGRHSLRNALSALRRQLEPGETPSNTVLVADRFSVRLNPSAVTVDVVEFEEALSLAKSRTEPNERIEALKRAVGYYGGELLPGFYDEWIPMEAERLAESHRQALRDLSGALEESGDLIPAIAASRRWIASDPFNEAAHRQLMRLLAASGEPTAAWRHFQAIQRSFQDAEEDGPSETTRRYAERLRADAKARTDEERPLAAPPPRATSPPLDPSPPPGPPLPPPRKRTSFIGRAAEIQTVKTLLERSPLVTLVGAGGVGKTRLSLQIAEGLSEAFSFGPVFVDLAPHSDPALLVSVTAMAMGAREEAGVPLIETVLKRVSSRTALLVMDNCEHLIEACAEWVDTLLNRCPGLRILATSREPLRVEGETIFYVPSLSLPEEPETEAELLQSEAARLFVERAQAASASFKRDPEFVPAAAQVCRKLDGIPLALEMAASLVRGMSLPEIAARLEGAMALLSSGSRTALPRHQTLRGMTEWSYQLLSEKEQRLLRRLSVFAGGWTLPAMEEACSGEGIEKEELPGGVIGLVDKSLVAREATENDKAGRYKLLETVRQYASERLREADEWRTWKDRHLNCFARFADPQNRDVSFWSDIENLFAAIDWCLEQPEHLETGMAIAARAAMAAWSAPSLILDRLVALLEASKGKDIPVRFELLGLTATLYRNREDWDRAQDLSEELRVEALRMGDGRALAVSHGLLGLACLHREQHREAEEWILKELEFYVTNKCDFSTAASYHHLGKVAVAKGEYDRAEAILGESISRFRSIKASAECDPLYYMGCLRLIQKRPREAKTFFAEMIKYHDESDQGCVIMMLRAVAGAAALEGSFREAARWTGQMEAWKERYSRPYLSFERRLFEGLEGSVRVALGEPAFSALHEEGRSMTLEAILSEVQTYLQPRDLPAA